MEKEKASSTNDTGLTGCQNANQFIFIILYKTQIQVDQRSQHKSRYTEHDRKESGK